ncbi:cytidylyltransferase domain-containing protein [Candidatus Planktophila dulcis]|uniref:acylneuraminate cytidylyltransferase family protein n=1 Tax=Candidatus Planktophila dulcis TaxID=1884914 RepID=UPI003CECF592
MEILSLIPARSGSKGVPDKNIKILAGHTLLEWSIRASLLSGAISRTIVSTDSPEYRDLAISKGAECPFLRPPEISTDSSSDIDFVNHALAELKQTGYKPDFIIHLRPTTPFRDPNVIEAAISQIENSEPWTSIRSVHEMSESAYKSFEIEKSGNLVAAFSKERNLESSNLGRQLFPKTFQANGYVDVLSVKHIVATGEIHGNSVRFFLTEPAIEIDTAFDFEVAEAMSDRNPKLAERLFV